MSGPNTAAQVGVKYDVVIDGFGYVLAREVDPNLPFRTQEALLSYTPTFVERSNVSGAYGDDQQSFWMTASQNDWSLGEQQKFLRVNDMDGRRRYWRGTSVDVSTPGQVSMRAAVASLTLAGAPKAVASYNNVATLATTTNVYTVDSAGTIVDAGAHNLGAAPATFGFVADGFHWYLSTTGAGTVGVRAWNGVSTYTTFSATGADSLEYLNNTLFGYRNASGDFGQYSTGGTFTSLFTFKGADGTALSAANANGQSGVLRAYGGKLLILRTGVPSGPELWIYDGTNTSLIAKFASNFAAWDLRVVQGIVFVSGMSGPYPMIYYYANGTSAVWWKSTATASLPPAMADFNGGLLINDDSTAALRFFDLTNSGIHTIGSYTVAGDTPLLVTSSSHVVHTRDQTTAYSFSPAGATASSATVLSSLEDFDSSLLKLLRGIKVDWSAATDGNGGTVDIAYQVDSLDGAWTTLQAGATSGTEYTLAGVSGHAVAVRITLNKGTSTLGPVLKRLYVRGVPVLQSYRVNQFVFDLGGVATNPVELRDGSESALTGEQMRANLAAAITAQAPVTIIDPSGSYTGILEPGGCEFDRTRPSQWFAQIKVREV